MDLILLASFSCLLRSQLTFCWRTARRPLPRQVLLKLIRPYTRIRIPFISQELNIPARDVEALLVTLILDSKVQGHIDQARRLAAPLRAPRARCGVISVQ